MTHDAASRAKRLTLAWPEPRPLPSTLSPVQAFEPDLLPASLRPWAMDIAERMQCPPDYVAATAVVALGAVLGRRIGIRPQEHTDWIEVPNLWGCIIGRPGVMKSPAMSHALRPIRRLDALAADENARAFLAHKAALQQFKAEQAAARTNLKNGSGASAPILGAVEPTAPPAKRYLVNDTSYEALGVVLADNPNGVMVFRDEVVSLLKPLDREENAPARGFFLSAWNGTEGYTFDRIMRGRTHIPACCVSLLGSTQPGKITAYLGDAVHGGARDDGLVQRIGLLVWPDVAPDWRDIDREPDSEGRRLANLTFDRLDALDPRAIGASHDESDPLPYLRFDPDALAEFKRWRQRLERRLRGDDLHDAMQSHLNKYRGLVPKLALLFHLADGGTGPVSLTALIRALNWAEYLETHAVRAYGSVTSASATGARALWSKVKAGALPSPFTARDVHQPGWTQLTDAHEVAAALDLLVEYDWLAEESVGPGPNGGRPTTLYTANPRGLAL